MNLDALKWGGALLLTLGLMGGSAWAAWAWQANAYGQQLAKQETSHQTTLTHLANANSALIIAEQGKRLALEQLLAASDQAHYRALTDEKTKQIHLRDRLATADLRLSALLAATDTNRCSGVPAAAGPGSVVHGAQRAQLDRAHAQRIIGIVGEGDEGLIALAACQEYVRGVAG
ncbi:lysis system i-spanin subunit Rz [Pseudomonas deceptionensis]|uniref:lysis system i-spanin subunit Rz n=1 Tax=Pseudomonas deceptionensis TaxID=882211 RepID=UPI00065D3A2C|nr:lysis system i-spanin subunit Rz [Pseudomonas deceptionensis]KMM80642.1 lysozyme [Pseudomonas deceptionensis]